MKKQVMNIPLKSVIMTIGPSGCSKSTLIEKQLVPQLEKLVPGANIQVLSSDEYRREILGKRLKEGKNGEEYISKTDDRMKYASEGAFKLMEAKFDAVTTWPITADFVILDATFIGEKTRLQFAQKAKNAQYQLIGLIFDFGDREEYFRYIDDIEHKLLISRHLKRFKEELRDIGRKYFDNIYIIKSKDHEIVVEKDCSYDLMKVAKLDEFNSYFIVGDIHGCLKEFKELLISVGFEIRGNRIVGRDDMMIVSVGDTVDKGDETPELIDFLYENMDRIKICIAGHDRHLTKCFEDNVRNDNGVVGKDGGVVGKDGGVVGKDKKYFDSIKKLTSEQLAKFYSIMERQCHFYVHNNFVVTHSPCENRYIGKFDSQSKKMQRSRKYPYRREFESDSKYIDAVHKNFSFIFDEAKKYDPYHIFGHVAMTDKVVIGNKVFLDTGCVYGNKLTGVIISRDNPGRLYFKSVQSSYPRGEYIINHSDILGIINEDNEIKFDSLEFKDKIDIIELSKNRVNFVSGTMSPCSSNMNKEVGEKTLEDMREALSYYKNHGVNKVMLQKKYMGSRANMYIFPNDIDKSYMVSRNGFVIKRFGLDLENAYKKMLDFLINKNIIDVSDAKLIIVDGELMPWSLLGRGLIESHFMTVGKGVESELRLLEDTGFEAYLEDFNKKYDDSGFKELKKTHKKVELIKVIGENQYRQMSSFDTFRWEDIEKQKNAIDIYNRQIDIYGKLEGDLEFKPFAVLKVVNTDGSEELFWNSSNEFVFTAVSDDEYLIVSIDDKDFGSGLSNARKWFDKIVQDNYEGIVVKPFEKVYIPGVAPYMKVRNPNYLTIIYGYDYTIEPKFTRILENKNIRGKLRTSIKEFDIGRRMLEIPYDSICEDNKEYLDICAKMVIEEKREKVFDPRL